ncbi:hypothetical protein KFK09_021931 [Dendrobium nobile]|uniref:Uncharacterized protein n=1 Tax=Dendrobium nobile TaxID=94219 RepID=A0A8T3AHI8_DENNO|nr:hypothetical protein KFK09_021931 [Dendrobium nobile]
MRREVNDRRLRSRLARDIVRRDSWASLQSCDRICSATGFLPEDRDGHCSNGVGSVRYVAFIFIFFYFGCLILQSSTDCYITVVKISWLLRSPKNNFSPQKISEKNY